MDTALSLVTFIIAIGVHEAAHALVAYRLGDTTARSAGRLTLNPLAHIDPFGTIVLPALLVLTGFPVVFGWAKPVPVNPLNFESPRKGMMMTSAAGPAANFITACIFGFIFRSFLSAGGDLPRILVMFCLYAVFLNVVIGIFNLIPVPPFDGSGILAGILPPGTAAAYLRFSRYGFLAVAALLYLGLFEKIIMPAAQVIMRFLTG